MSQSSISKPSGPSVSTAGIPIQQGSAYPRAFGEYLLLTSFGRGGMGEVYLAKKAQIEGIDHLCVLKRLRSDLGEEEEYVRRFIDEARLVVQLNHGNICHVFDVGRVGPDHFLAMEYIPGVNLRTITERLAKEGEELPPALALYLATEVLDALDYAHRFKNQVSGETINLVHRDVSPHNVMVSFEGETKLIDFGLAASELRDEKTESHVVMGKVSYMSPEQARGDDVSGATDQFATAIILYELLSGKRFYGERRLHEIWQIVGVGDYLPDGFDEDIDEELQPLIKRALSGRPADRFASCEELHDELSRLLHTKHGGVGKRQLRELVQRICADEERHHREVLKTYRDLSSDSVSQSDEATMSFASRPAPASDSHSLPTGVMPKEQALQVSPFRSETEETATATAFLGPKSLPGSGSVPVVPGPAWARPVVMGLLLSVGVIGGVYLTRHLDDGPRDVIVTDRPTPAVKRTRPPPLAVDRPATAETTELLPVDPATDPTAAAATDELATDPATDLTADPSETDAPTTTDPDEETPTVETPTIDEGATPPKRRQRRQRRRGTATVTTSAPTTPTTPEQPRDTTALATTDGPSTEPDESDDAPATEPGAGPAATPFEVEQPAEEPPQRVEPPEEDPPPPPPKKKTAREIVAAMSTDEVRTLLRELAGYPVACVSTMKRYGITPDADKPTLDKAYTRTIIGRCAGDAKIKID